jgi:hypothetical protein
MLLKDLIKPGQTKYIKCINPIYIAKIYRNDDFIEVQYCNTQRIKNGNINHFFRDYEEISEEDFHKFLIGEL